MDLRHDDHKEHGQILIMFALVLVAILAFTSIVVDVGMLRNNRQILVNAVDATALAGGTLMPVDGSIAGKAAAANAIMVQTMAANYPGITGSEYIIEYKCLIGVTAASPAKPRITDIPTTCNPATSLGWTGFTTLAAKEAAFVGAGPTRYASCNPAVGDKCNVVLVTGTKDTPFYFGRVVGVNSGSTGAVSSAACNGPCGAPPTIPVDVVLIMDRTLSMSAQDIADIQTGASTLLSVFDPAIQRVALGTIGPSQVGLAACPGGSTSPVKGLGSPANQVYGVGQSPASNVNWFAASDLPKWMPVGFSGQDASSPAVTFNEAYSSAGVTNTNSTIWKAISCFYSYTTGTNLDTPLSMAQQYLATYGRPGVKKGIIFETDGTPQAGDGSAHYTCNAANNTATAAKSVAGGSIEIFTIGFGIGTAKCPNRTGTSCVGGTGTNNNESVAWDCKSAASLLTSMATDANHFYNAPTSATLISAFQQAAIQLAGGGSHLITLQPQPIVTSFTPGLAGSPPFNGSKAGGTSVVITGLYLTGATAVTFGGTPAGSFTVNNDSTITAISPAGSANALVDIRVTTPGGSSPAVSGDQFRYGP